MNFCKVPVNWKISKELYDITLSFSANGPYGVVPVGPWVKPLTAITSFPRRSAQDGSTNSYFRTLLLTGEK